MNTFGIVAMSAVASAQYMGMGMSPYGYNPMMGGGNMMGGGMNYGYGNVDQYSASYGAGYGYGGNQNYEFMPMGASNYVAPGVNPYSAMTNFQGFGYEEVYPNMEQFAGKQPNTFTVAGFNRYQGTSQNNWGMDWGTPAYFQGNQLGSWNAGVFEPNYFNYWGTQAGQNGNGAPIVNPATDGGLFGYGRQQNYGYGYNGMNQGMMSPYGYQPQFGMGYQPYGMGYGAGFQGQGYYGY